MNKNTRPSSRRIDRSQQPDAAAPFPPGTASAGPAASETSDPNFTAASRDRGALTGDTRTPRMNTGNSPITEQGRGACGAADPKTVRDAMTADVAVCNPDTELYYVARMMEERDCGAIPVVQSTDSMRPIGIVTDRDIVVRAVAKNEDALALRARDIMSLDILSVHPDMSLDECIHAMERRQVRRALVIDHTGRCCGIIAQADIARKPEKVGEFVQHVSEPTAPDASPHYH